MKHLENILENGKNAYFLQNGVIFIKQMPGFCIKLAILYPGNGTQWIFVIPSLFLCDLNFDCKLLY